MTSRTIRAKNAKELVSSSDPPPSLLNSIDPVATGASSSWLNVGPDEGDGVGSEVGVEEGLQVTGVGAGVFELKQMPLRRGFVYLE